MIDHAELQALGKTYREAYAKLGFTDVYRGAEVENNILVPKNSLRPNSIYMIGYDKDLDETLEAKMYDQSLLHEYVKDIQSGITIIGMQSAKPEQFVPVSLETRAQDVVIPAAFLLYHFDPAHGLEHHILPMYMQNSGEFFFSQRHLHSAQSANLGAKRVFDGFTGHERKFAYYAAMQEKLAALLK